MRTADGEHTWDVTKFGAVGDNSTDNTAAFTKALTEAYTAHGGMVYVPRNHTHAIPLPHRPDYSSDAS